MLADKEWTLDVYDGGFWTSQNDKIEYRACLVENLSDKIVHRVMLVDLIGVIGMGTGHVGWGHGTDQWSPS